MTAIVRVNTRVSSEINNWLDNRSRQTGMPKSMLIHLALDHFIQQQQQQTTDTNQELDEIKKELKTLSKKVNQLA